MVGGQHSDDFARNRSQRDSHVLMTKRIEQIVGCTTATDGGQVVGQGGPGSNPGGRFPTERDSKAASVGLKCPPFAPVRRSIGSSEFGKARNSNRIAKVSNDDRAILERDRSLRRAAATG